jgi:uncharacterized protein YkwD
MQIPDLPFPSLSGIDVLLAFVVLAGAWSGWKRGFFATTTALLMLAASFLVALWGHAAVAAWFVSQALLPDPWAAPAAFLLVLSASAWVLGASGRLLMRLIPYRSHAHVLNRAIGVVPGAASGLIHAAVIAMLLLALPVSDRLTDWAQRSTFAERLSAPIERVEEQLRPIFDPAVQRTMQGLTVAPESQEFVKLPFSVQDAKPRPDLEAAMLALVNAERGKAGLRLLVADPEALHTARAHSQDMFARSYFSHVTPEGRSPFDRMRSAGLRFRVAGENLALARTLPMAHQGLMKSPGHRANILKPEFGRLAIGIVDGGRNGLMVTQTFRN